MSSLLLVTADVHIESQVEEATSELALRIRVVNSVGAAQKWIAMQHFDALFVDARYGERDIVKLLSIAWKHHPLLQSLVFDFYDEVGFAVTVKMLGAQVCTGDAILSEMLALLRALPTSFAFAENSYFAVLVVEDLDSPRDIICAYIESLGYPKVTGVGSVVEALETLRSAPYDYFCVVTDIQMPKESGVALTTKIRADSELSFLPIVVLTSVATSENLMDCLKAGASGFLVKPPKKKLLLQELEKAKRIVLAKRSPSLCDPSNSKSLEVLLKKTGLVPE